MDANVSRRLAGLRRRGLFHGLPEGLTIALAVTPDKCKQAWRLVHEVFVTCGYIEPQPDGLYPPTGDAVTFVALSGGRVVGAQCLVRDNGEGLPADAVFPIGRKPGRRLYEATREAVAVDYRGTAVPTELMRCCFAYVQNGDGTDVLTVVSTRHARLYEMLGFVQCGNTNRDKPDDPLVLMSFNGDDITARAKARKSDDAFLAAYFIDNNPYLDGVMAC